MNTMPDMEEYFAVSSVEEFVEAGTFLCCHPAALKEAKHKLFDRRPTANQWRVTQWIQSMSDIFEKMVADYFEELKTKPLQP
jgi:predicted O-linked N-acetylglucosamine transferase (SPINDLY family)